MISLVAVLPAVVLLIAVLGLRASGLVAAIAAAVCAAVIALLAPFIPPATDMATRAFADAAILTLTAAAMIVPGILFVEATRRQKATDALAGLVTALDLPPARAAIFVAVGLGVAIESMTGMGVSLLVTVPLLLGLVERRAAIGLALVGMSLMPWGALGISGIVGAKLAAVDPDTYAVWVSRVSGAVAFLLPLLCLTFISHPGFMDVRNAAGLGVVLVVTIVLTSFAAGLELAGVVGGLAVMAALVPWSRRKQLVQALRHSGLVPYAALIIAVVVQKLCIGPAAAAGFAPSIGSGRISFALLASPGLALTIATLIASGRHIDGEVIRATANRAWRPVASIALFMISARLLVECGAIGALATTLGRLGPTWAAIATVLLGAVSGFVTGSGVSGNALFMVAAAETGRSFGALPLFAALQNGAAGHSAMASLPVAAILLAALPNRTREDDRTALRLGLTLAGVHTLVLVVTAMVWLWIGV